MMMTMIIVISLYMPILLKNDTKADFATQMPSLFTQITNIL